MTRQIKFRNIRQHGDSSISLILLEGLLLTFLLASVVMTTLRYYKYGLHQELDNGVDQEAAYWPEKKDTVTTDTTKDLGDA